MRFRRSLLLSWLACGVGVLALVLGFEIRGFAEETSIPLIELVIDGFGQTVLFLGATALLGGAGVLCFFGVERWVLRY